ncbi:MAG: rod shape-determining protein MreC [Candidatus Krumholzibacteriia bacterium]
MTHLSPPSGRVEIFVFLVCVALSLVLLVLPESVQVIVAGRLADVLTAPYHRTRNFIADVGDVGEENAHLKARVAELELRLAARQRAAADSVRSAEPVLGQELAGRLVPCRVEVRKRARFAGMIRIRTLEPAPLRPYLAVISSRGFLGRVSALEGERTAWVELMVSPEMALGVEIERTGLLAVLRTRAGQLALDLVARDEDVQPGDRLITSGIVEARETDVRLERLGTIPRGLPVGTVRSVAAPSDEIFKDVMVEPLASFDRNETVFVVLPESASRESGARRQAAGRSSRPGMPADGRAP